MNVDLMLAQHKSMNLAIEKEYNLKDIKNICKEVFKEKAFVLRKTGTFGDSVNINAVSITEEEKTNLIQKINEKYELKIESNNIIIESNSNIRIRDLIRPYIAPTIISFVIIYAYMAIRFRKLNILKTLLTITGIIFVTEIVLASLIAIIRIPVTPIVLNIMFVIGVAELIVFIYKKERELETSI